ncbi:MAG TPA: polyprenyl diphosphate synthase [Candidatus Aminicenantes bacterium]|nr:polyprenyl diphosphate synthase [Candidatus Aminicenantes bacterium]
MIPAFAGFLTTDSEAAALLERIDLASLPRHVAIIMDGNGRWAKSHGLDRTEGHRRGAEAARVVCECASRLGIGQLTLYAFSSENWKRPAAEIGFLMDLLYDNLIRRIDLLNEGKARLKVIGDADGLPPRLAAKLRDTEAESRDNPGIQVNLALNYGGRSEIVRAIHRLATRGVPLTTLDEATFATALDTAGIPDPDLLIRTSGEMRISNFLLFQLAYTELSFPSTLWPDFGPADLFRTIIDFQHRARRFGGL